MIDVRLVRPPTDAEIAQLARLPFVVGSIERERHDVLRIVVDDAAAALDRIRAALDDIGLDLVEAAEHTVDDDEAFVRVVERHRSAGAGAGDDGESEDAPPDAAAGSGTPEGSVDGSH